MVEPQVISSTRAVAMRLSAPETCPTIKISNFKLYSLLTIKLTAGCGHHADLPNLAIQICNGYFIVHNSNGKFQKMITGRFTSALFGTILFLILDFENCVCFLAVNNS